MKSAFSALFILVSLSLESQGTVKEILPYAEVPAAPRTYTAGTAVSRMVDGLGFRCYWATEGLTDKELDYSPGNEVRTIRQTMTHLFGLSVMILNSAKKQANDGGKNLPELTFEENRSALLNNLKIASALFAVTEDLGEHTIQFKTKNGLSEFPFWNNINGPIEDAVWHAGQVVVLRRAAGNPINPKVNVFSGKLND